MQKPYERKRKSTPDTKQSLCQIRDRSCAQSGGGTSCPGGQLAKARTAWNAGTPAAAQALNPLGSALTYLPQTQGGSCLSTGLHPWARLQGDAEHCITDLSKGPTLAKGLVGVVPVGQGQEHGVIGQEDQPPIHQALGPGLSITEPSARSCPGAPSACTAPQPRADAAGALLQASPEAQKPVALDSCLELVGPPSPLCSHYPVPSLPGWGKEKYIPSICSLCKSNIRGHPTWVQPDENKGPLN